MTRAAFDLLRRIWTHPANRNARCLAVSRFAGWQVRKRTRPTPVDIEYHGLRLRCYPDSHSASAALYFSGLADYREMLFIQRYLRPGDRFVDIGANIGVYSMLAASCVGSSGFVEAFEPATVQQERLAENVRINGLTNVLVHPFAVSDVEGEIRFVPTADDCTAHMLGMGEQGLGSYAVRAVTLDQCLLGKRVAMVKLDIEGAEPLAVRGARNMLRVANPPVMQIEMDGYSKNYGVSTEAFIAELAGYGYECGYYEPRSNQVRYTSRPWEHGVQNVLAVANSARGHIEARLGAG